MGRGPATSPPAGMLIEEESAEQTSGQGSNGKIEDEEGPGQRGTVGGLGALALAEVGSRIR